MDPSIVRSPISDERITVSVPDISLPEFLFQALDMNYEILKDQIWVEDVLTGASYRFSDMKPLTTKIANALTKLGFKKGDTLFFSTYDAALIYMVYIGVWLCGGVVRGCYQKEDLKELERQMKEVSAGFILCDSETEEGMKEAAGRLGWPVKLLSIGGKVEGATAIEDMIANEDCSAFQFCVNINSKEDACFVVQTNGSTGIPKGILYTHSGLITLYSHLEQPKKIGEERVVGKTCLTITANFLVTSYLLFASSIVYGFSLLSIPKFDQKKLISQIMKHKPETVVIFPYVANAFAKSDELSKLDFSFLKNIYSGGSVFPIETAKQLAIKMPHVKVKLGYGMSELIFHSCSSVKNVEIPEESIIAGLKVNMLDGNWHVSCGPLLPHAEAKIGDPNLKCSIGRNKKGNLWVRSPCIMKGYLKPESEKGYFLPIDEDGWFETGDIAYFDDTDNLYIVERSSSTFKCCMNWVSPTEIESIISEHPAVSSVGVIGIPNAKSASSAARAYVVLKSGYKATEEEIKQFVAGKTVFYKHLHEGVVFVDQLPQTKGGKVSRTELLKMAQAACKTKQADGIPTNAD